MMTQNQGASTVVDKETTATTEFLEHKDDQVVELSPDDKANFAFQLLEDATENIVSYAKWLVNQKQILNKFDYKQLLQRWGWKSKEEKLYLKVAATFEQFSPENLIQVEPATIFQLARSSKKYQSVLDALLKLPQITQEKVRSLIEQCRAPKQPKSEKPSIWRQTTNGGRYCQIPPIHEQETGATLQQMMDEEGLTAQSIITEAIALRQAYRERRLVAVETDVTVWERGSEDGSEETSRATVSQVEAIRSVTEGIAESSTLNEQPVVGEEDSSDDEWTFEPESEKDDLDDDEESVNYRLDASEREFQIEKVTELSPVELLVETFQSCVSWQEISEVLKIHDEYKQQAWDALTPLERRRVMAIMPIEIQKLSEAKKAGKIIDYKEVRSGVYQVQHEGYLFWEVVSDSRLDAFLAQL
jgi:hypothetical protein